MTYQLEDIAPQLKKEKEERQSQQIEQLRYQVGVGNAVSEIGGDTKWSVYVGHINALIESAEQQVRGFEQSLGSGEFLGPEKCGQVRVKLADARGFAKGLKQSTQILVDLVEKGEKAAEQTYQLTKDEISQ